MKAGSFQAAGYEAMQVTNPFFLLPFIGALQFLLLILLDVLPSIRWLLIELFWPSLAICAVSFVVLIVQRLTSNPTGNLEVSFLDDRDNGGALKFSYINSKGRKRVSLVPKKIVVDSRSPLLRKGGRMFFPVAGTKASMTIFFGSPRIALALGFPSQEEMERVYAGLKDRDEQQRI